LLVSLPIVTPGTKALPVPFGHRLWSSVAPQAEAAEFLPFKFVVPSAKH
jgi:hypothetical protein